MRNFWLMAKHEYGKMVRKRSFLLTSLGIPLLIVVIMGISIFSALGSNTDAPVGYVDTPGILDANVEIPTSPDTEWIDVAPLREFADEAAARSALEAEEIQAYYVLPAGYPQTDQSITLYHGGNEPGDGVQAQFDDFLRANLMRPLPQNVQQRLVDGSHLTTRSADGNRAVGRDSVVSFILPFVAAFFFFFVVMAASGYLLQVVADEKENRTVEIMITSMTPEQLIGGKALGLMGVALTQILIWSAAIVIGLVVGAQYIDALRSVQIPWTFLGVAVLYFLPAFALIAGLMTAIGGVVTETRQGQQIAGVLNMLFIAPFFFTALIFSNPNSPVLTFLTLFPTTSFLTVTLRWGISTIPLWQMVTSWVLLVATAGTSVWASARIFRAGMLRYGQRLSLDSILAAIGIGRQATQS